MTTSKLHLVHLQCAEISRALIEHPWWADRPQMLYFGDGSVEVIGLADDLEGAARSLTLSDEDVTVLGPLELRERVDSASRSAASAS